ncbi:MAG TPA: polyphosphate polymerase domain-containing protein [Thermomicrobiales bacterium]|nr:polyphosphate polymerase domain-containing protein [Thermomicrobiales bacterium]
MTIRHIPSSLSDFAPITLTELQERASFMERKDRKYLVPIDAMPDLLAEFPDGSQVLEIEHKRRFRYESLYFDDAAFPAYHLGLRRRPNRFKVRTRHYVESGLRHLEVKTLGNRGETIKTRILHQSSDLMALSASEYRWLEHFPQVRPFVDGLAACLSTTYERSTIVLPGSTGRVTMDSRLTWSEPGGDLISLHDEIVIETKGNGKPTLVDRVLWRAGYRPVPLSKFGVGLSLLRPELPANRWHRIGQWVCTGIAAGPGAESRRCGFGTEIRPLMIAHR